MKSFAVILLTLVTLAIASPTNVKLEPRDPSPVAEAAPECTIEDCI